MASVNINPMSPKISRLQRLYVQPRREPYAVKLDFSLGSGSRVEDFGDGVCIPIAKDKIITIKKKESAPWDANFSRYSLNLEGYASAGEAEESGLRLAQSLLWLAISGSLNIRLDYESPLPCIVYDRVNQSSTLSMFGYGHAYSTNEIGFFIEPMKEIFSRNESVDRQLLLSMEIFCASQMEVTNRARFITLISSLEIFASPKEYSNEVKKMIENLQKIVSETIEESDNQEMKLVKDSLKGRLKHLKEESITQSLKRFITESFEGSNDFSNVIDEAYSLRSRIVHGGQSDPYLDQKIYEVQNIMRQLYARRVGSQLISPAV